VRVVVTGGAGFLGSHVAQEFLSAGYEVVIFDQAPPVAPGLEAATHLPGDLLDLATLERAATGAALICHLAGVGDVYRAAAEPFTAAALNVVGTTNVAEAARRAGVRKLVYASTWEVYGAPDYQPIDERHPCRPDHPYNITKYAGELMALAYDRLHDLPTLALRLGTAYGPRMRPNSVFSLFIDRARAGQPLTVQGSGDQTRQFTHARDIARGFRLAAESAARGAALNLVASESVAIRELAELVIARYPTRLESAEARVGDIHPAIIDASKARSVIGWEARVPFRTGLAELMEIASATPA
jgi:UDP-glucose 4-epimerase